MARRTQIPAEPHPANLSPEQMVAAIPKLRRRIADLEEFDPMSVDDRSDPRIKVFKSDIDTMLATIFDPDTVEYRNYRVAANIDRASHSTHGTPIREVRDGLARGRQRAIALLESIIRTFEEALGDLGESDSGRALRAIEGLDLHPEIEIAAGKLYRDGHYANAVEDACKALNALVKLRSGRDDLDGVTLMQQVFGGKTPTLRFNDFADDSDRNEQQGFMHLFTGAMMGFRNPRAHKIIQDDTERALEYIALISLLAKLLDDAHRA